MRVQMNDLVPPGQVLFLDPTELSPWLDDDLTPRALIHPTTAQEHPDLYTDLKRQPFPHQTQVPHATSPT